MSDDYASAYRTAPLRVAVDATCTHLQKDYLDNNWRCSYALQQSDIGIVT